MPSQQSAISAFAAGLEWRRTVGVIMTRPWSEHGDPGPVERTSQAIDDVDAPAPARRFFDASLLFRCLDMLEVDRSELAGHDPLLFRELQGLCALCQSKQECSQDLAGEFGDARWDKWFVYCPNSATLTKIWAVRHGV